MNVPSGARQREARVTPLRQIVRAAAVNLIRWAACLLWHARRCLSLALGDWRRAELVDIAPDAGASVLVGMGVWVVRAK